MSAPEEKVETAVLERVSEMVLKEKNRLRINLLAFALSSFLLALLVVSLMPGPRNVANDRDDIVERRLVQVICWSLLLISPVTVVGVCLKHPSVNNAVLMFVAGIGSGSVCAISFMMIGVNIFLALTDIVRGKFRLELIEMIAINILVATVSIITYFQTFLSKKLYEVYVEKERNASISTSAPNSAPEVVTEYANNGRAVKSSRTAGSYDLSSADYNFF